MIAERVVIGGRLRGARQVLGLSQDDVATALGMNRSAISEIETGTRKLYALELRRFARLYRRPVAWLLGEQPDPDVSDEVLATAAGLSSHDRDVVLQFARFLTHQKALAWTYLEPTGR